MTWTIYCKWNVVTKTPSGDKLDDKINTPPKNLAQYIHLGL